MDKQAKIELDELRKEGRARYEDRYGCHATIYVDDTNACVKLRVHNYYGNLIHEQHFNYYSHQNAVRSAKESLEQYYPRMFRRI